MLPITIPVDAEKAVIDYLSPVLAEYAPDVGIDVRGGGGRFVRVRRIGGVELTPLHDAPMLDVLVWHDDDKQRMRIALALWSVLRAAACDPAGDAVLLYDSTTLGPRQMPDPADDTKSVCMFSVQMIVRPAADSADVTTPADTAVAGSPGHWLPLGAVAPLSTAMSGIVADPNHTWSKPQYVVCSDGVQMTYTNSGWALQNP